MNMLLSKFRPSSNLGLQSSNMDRNSNSGGRMRFGIVMARDKEDLWDTKNSYCSVKYVMNSPFFSQARVFRFQLHSPLGRLRITSCHALSTPELSGLTGLKRRALQALGWRMMSCDSCRVSAQQPVMFKRKELSGLEKRSRRFYARKGLNFFFCQSSPSLGKYRNLLLRH